jgi:outer membrane receptor for ferrienterochelin and colicins
MTVRRLLVLLLIPLCSSSARAQEQPRGDPRGEVPSETVLGMELEELMNVEVYTPSKKPERRQIAPASVVVITRQQIMERGYESLEDALRDLPGFDFIHVQGTWPTIWTQRGLYGDENKRTLLLIDGIVENNLLEGSVLGGPQYSLHGVERIEVTYGPASALFGANAFGGVINIVTMRGRDTAGLQYQKGAGSYRTRYDKLLIGAEAHEVDVVVSGSLYDSDGPVFEERHPRYSNSYVDNAYSIIGRLSYRGITLGFNRFDRPMGEGQFSNSPGYYGLPGYGYGGAEGSSGGTAQSDVFGERPTLWHAYTQTAFVKGEVVLADHVELFAVAYHRNTGIALDSYEYDYPGSGPDLSRDPYGHDSSSTGSELRASFAIDDNQDIVAGTQFEWSDIERGYRGSRTIVNAAGALEEVPLGDDERVSDAYANAAVYAQYQLHTELLHMTNFTLGGRVDRSNRYGSSFNPRASIVVAPTERLTFKVLAGTAYRAPNSFEMFTETNIRKANPDLVPEREVSTEASVSLAVTPDLLVEATGFRNHFTHIIVSNVETGEPIPGSGELTYKQNRNVGDADITGLELKTTAFASEYFDVFANFTYQHAEQNDGTSTYSVPNVARVKGNVGATARFPQLFSLYLAGNWVGPRTTAPANPDEEIPGYFVTNAALYAKELPVEDLGLLVTVNNLLDVKYVDPGIRSANGSYYGTRHVQPGRSAFVKLILSL